MLKVNILVVGPVMTNCYIVSDDSHEAVIIDPGENAKGIIGTLDKIGAKPAAILLTHGHFDHITAVPELLEAYPELPVYAYREEKVLLEDSVLNESGSMGEGIVLDKVRYLDDGAELTLLGETWKLIATPGHTIGSCCYYVESASALFSGDTLFAGDCGRTDLPTGSMPQILHSIREVLMKLPDETAVLPGHEEMTSIGVERKRNMVMRMR